jgi:hypothetical protein
VIRDVPGAAGVAAAGCTTHDYRDPGKPRIAWDDEQARAALVSALVNDALGLLGHLPGQLGGPAADAIGLLALAAGQDVEPAEGSDGPDGRWRIARRTATDRMVSVTDPDARHVHKNRTRHQEGFKAHVSFEPETGLFSGFELTGGSGAAGHEATVAASLLAGEQETLTILGDAAYGTGELRQRLQAGGHATVIKPPPLRQVIPSGFTIDDFTVDDQAGTVTCPAGHAVTLGRPQAPSARPADRRPPRRRRPGLAGRVPPAAPAGRAGHRLAGRPRQPPRPLPRHHQEQRMAQSPGRRPQPPPAHQPRPHPHQPRHLGTRVTQPRPPDPEPAHTGSLACSAQARSSADF